MKKRKPGQTLKEYWQEQSDLTADQVPELLREAFDALRDPTTDTENRSFSLSQIEVEGEVVWAICAHLITEKGHGIFPLFMQIPSGLSVKMGGVEANYIDQEDIDAVIKQQKEKH